MASNSDGLQPNSVGLQPNSDGLPPNSDGLQPIIAMASNLKSVRLQPNRNGPT